MRAVIKNAGEPAKVVDVQGDLDSIKAVVGGWITAVPTLAHGLRGLDVFANDEGLLLQLPANVRAPWGDLIVGNLIVLARDEEGDAADLTEEQADRARRALDALDARKVSA